MKNIFWLVSYPKSGNTWFRMFLANYLANTSDPLSLNEIKETAISSSALDFEEFIGLNPFELTPDEVDLYRPELYRMLSNNSNDIIYKKTHDAYTYNDQKVALFPKDVSIGAVYFVRNPLDVCISYANHSSSNVEKTVQLINDENATIAGKKTGQLRQKLLSWQEHYMSWNNQTNIPIHLVRYEDMKRQPISTFKGIIQFLQLDYDEDRLKKAISNSDFNLLKEMENTQGFSERTQKCKHFFWKGTICNYQKYLSEEQVETIIKMNQIAMRELNYMDTNRKLTL